MNGTMPFLQSDATQEHSSNVLAGAPALAGMPRFASKLLPLKQAQALYERARRWSDGFVLEGLLHEMNIALSVSRADFERIPKRGPAVVVANHPFGMLDGAVLSVVLSRVRPDVKIMTNFLLEGVPELEQHCIFVDPLHTPQARRKNLRALKQALEWLEHGGMLGIFPSGEVSHWQLPQAAIVDPRWSEIAVRLIRKTAASALPVYFCGQNSLGFQLAGILHPRLRLAFLLQEFLQQQGKDIVLRIGNGIPAKTITGISDDRLATDYLRWRTYLLSERGKKRVRLPAALRSWLPSKADTEITPAPSSELLLRDLSSLPPQRLLAENGDFAVYAARAAEIPNLLQEVGRLREITFRAANEGTGKSTDLDRFDHHYWHLLLWHKEQQELVGAYRAANTQDVIAQYGIQGLYTSTLFHYDLRLFEHMGPALELGRSFVRPEYQRQYAPLLLLWKAIARFVSMKPETPVLFGAVSISNTYNHASRELIYSFFESRRGGDGLADLVSPRRPFRPAWLRNWDCRALCSVLRDLEELSEPIADLEVDGKGIPVLLKQYAKVGGKLLGFNVDRKFSDVLDGLVVVDLRETDHVILERYMGREALAGFRRHHGLG